MVQATVFVQVLQRLKMSQLNPEKASAQNEHLGAGQPQ